NGASALSAAGNTPLTSTQARDIPLEDTQLRDTQLRNTPGGSKSTRNKVLVGGAGLLAVAAVAAVIAAPRLLGSSDPGCKAYSATAIVAYNKTITALNKQSPQATVSADMAATVSGLTSAAAQAHSATVRSALNGLLAEVKTVRSDVQAGSVPVSTVNALNAASAKADNAC
ncbi:MAG TPA: hypothetical protein VHF26_20025, partial [Trebonia sp.]|nr:hypothetical protein [Trebonia sp.]